MRAGSSSGLVALLTACLAGPASVQEHAPEAELPAWRFEAASNPELPPGFLQGTLQRPDGSRQSFFLGDFDPAPARRPLFVYVEGSGAQSLFVRVGERVAYTLFGVMAKRYGSRFHVAAAEKRGVAFAESAGRGTAEHASKEYAEHATLEGRADEVLRLVDALLAEPRVDPSRVMLVGHSEGADVVSAVAAREPRVTHVAFLAGGGPTQFFDLLVLKRKELRAQGKSADEIEEAVAAMEEDYRRLLRDPDSTEKLFLGHAHRRWSSFCLNPPVESLARCEASLFLAHGSADVSVPIESFDFLVVELLRLGREDVYARRYPDRDHSFIPVGSAPGYEGFFEVVDEFLEWVDAEEALSR